MCERCLNYCSDNGPRRNSKAIKKQLLKICNLNGLNTNSKIANVTPKWADEILKVSIGSGAKQRYRDISYYLAGLCEQLSDLTDDQKKYLENDLSSISDNPITTMMVSGKKFCDNKIEQKIEALVS